MAIMLESIKLLFCVAMKTKGMRRRVIDDVHWEEVRVQNKIKPNAQIEKAAKLVLGSSDYEAFHAASPKECLKISEKVFLKVQDYKEKADEESRKSKGSTTPDHG